MRSQSKRAFTLVELLVVIGIIAVLVSILIPALGRAQGQARLVACQSNLRQLAMWATMYANDNKGVLPVHGDPSLTNTWNEISDTTWYSKAAPTLYKGSKYKSGTPMHCPEAANNVPLRASSLGINYGLNHYLGGRKDFGGAGIAPRPISKLLKSDSYWFADGRVFASSGAFDFHPVLSMFDNGSFTNQYPWTWDTTSVSGWKFKGHSNSVANFAFGDGHVAAMDQKEYFKMNALQRKRFLASPF